MLRCKIIFYLYAFGLFQKGLTSVIETQQTVVAAVGEEAHFSCKLLQFKDVHQVTWQKILPEGEKNMASFNKRFGQTVKPDFRDKVEFESESLQNSSIVIRRVREQDECCYRCLFNTYPDGALTGTTCLQLYELHEPVLHVRESDPVVSCSVTGRPAPTVTLNVTQRDLHLSNYSTVSVSNTNGTTTVTTSAVLSGFHRNGAQVGCVVRVSCGPQREVFVTIPEVKQTSADEVGQPSADGFTWVIVLAALVVMICCCVAALIVRRRQRNNNRDPEEIQSPQKPINDTPVSKSPPNTPGTEVRQRTPTERSLVNNQLNSSTPTARRLSY